MDYEEIDDLLETTDALEDGPVKLALFEEAIREIDAIGDVEFAYHVREEYIRIAVFSGFKEKGLVAFSWCLAQFKDSPEIFDEQILLWMFKWVAENLTSFPTIPKSQILEIEAEMKLQFQKFDYSLRPVQQVSISNKIMMGDLEEGKKLLPTWNDHPRDNLVDCEACEQNTLVTLATRTQQYEKALEEAEPIFDEKMTCEEIPHLTHGSVLWPLLKLNRKEECKPHFKKGYALTKNNRVFLSSHSEYLLYCTAISNFDTAMKIFEDSLQWAVETKDIDSQFQFYDSSTLLLQAFARKTSNQKLNLPKEIDCYQENDLYNIEALADWFDKATIQLAEQFNQRNGNKYYTHCRLDKRGLLVESGVLT